MSYTYGEGNGSPLQYSFLENPAKRSLAGYSPWSHKESHNWATEHPYLVKQNLHSQKKKKKEEEEEDLTFSYLPDEIIRFKLG